MIDRIMLVVLMLLNIGAALLNVSIGGWGLIAAAFSYALALYCAYVLGRIS